MYRLTSHFKGNQCLLIMKCMRWLHLLAWRMGVHINMCRLPKGCFHVNGTFKSCVFIAVVSWSHSIRPSRVTSFCPWEDENMSLRHVIQPLYHHTLLDHSWRCDSMIILQLKIKAHHRTYPTTGSCKLYRGEMWRCFFKAHHPHMRWGQWQQLWSCCVNVLNMTQFYSDGASANLSNGFFTNA